jgi:hypothetical protein
VVPADALVGVGSFELAGGAVGQQRGQVHLDDLQPWRLGALRMKYSFIDLRARFSMPV